MSRSELKDEGPREPDSMSFEAARDAAIREGLRMTPAERLRWLEETMAEMEGLVGRARPPAGVEDDEDG